MQLVSCGEAQQDPPKKRQQEEGGYEQQQIVGGPGIIGGYDGKHP
jgi:hypothetical protein